LIKIHKVDAPIRPIVNWTNAPPYKLAKLLLKQLQLHTPLSHAFYVQNTPHLIKDLLDIPYNNKLRLASFDISNMFTNIPTKELITVIELTCQNNYIDENMTRDLTKLAKTLITQNYFRFENMIYLQPDSLAMGAPSSSTLSEFYLQHVESHKIYSLLLNHKVEGYFRYVDDILIIYNEDNMNIYTLLNHFNNISPKLKFTIEKKEKKKKARSTSWI